MTALHVLRPHVRIRPKTTLTRKMTAQSACLGHCRYLLRRRQGRFRTFIRPGCALSAWLPRSFGRCSKDHLAKAFEAQLGLLQAPHEPHIGAHDLVDGPRNRWGQGTLMTLSDERFGLFRAQAHILRWRLHSVLLCSPAGIWRPKMRGKTTGPQTHRTLANQPRE